MNASSDPWPVATHSEIILSEVQKITLTLRLQADGVKRVCQRCRGTAACGGAEIEGLEDLIMAQAAVESAVSGGVLIGRPTEVPRMKRKTPSELRVMPLSP
jgi:hypothetical protein